MLAQFRKEIRQTAREFHGCVKREDGSMKPYTAEFRVDMVQVNKVNSRSHQWTAGETFDRGRPEGAGPYCRRTQPAASGMPGLSVRLRPGIIPSRTSS